MIIVMSSFASFSYCFQMDSRTYQGHVFDVSNAGEKKTYLVGVAKSLDTAGHVEVVGEGRVRVYVVGPSGAIVM